MSGPTRYTVLLRTLIFVFQGEKLLLMQYSGRGGHQTQEKTSRKDIFNPIGGHVEAGEDVLASARREAQEEAGITLDRPEIKGIINVAGFAGKNMINFVITATTRDTPLESTAEGQLHWVNPSEIDQLNVFADLKPILEKLQTMQPHETFTGTAHFEGFTLRGLTLTVN